MPARQPSRGILVEQGSAYDRAVVDTVALADDRRVVLGDETSGGSKNHTRFGVLDEARVVVKIQANHGRLRNEHVALRFAGSHELPCPRVVASGTTDDGAFFLVLSREEGHRTTTLQGWGRLGFDVAKLASIPTVDCELARTEPQGFVDDHLERLSAVAPLLDRGHQGEIARAIDHIGRNSSLALTHGDPGSGNYLDHPGGGTILDWETAHVAPFGLDAGRAAFIALLDLTRTGIARELHAGFVESYRSKLANSTMRLDDETLHAATLAAALQFIHGRHTRPLRSDRTAQQAVATMSDYLRRTT